MSSSVPPSPPAHRIPRPLAGEGRSIVAAIASSSGRKGRRFVNVFVDDGDIRFEEWLEARLVEGQKLSILPAVAGGSGVEL